jgi:endo-1,4-beta-xylanase
MEISRREFVAGGAAIAALELAGCGGHRLPGVPAPPEVETLRAVAARQGLLAGCAVQVRHLCDDPGYAALVSQQAGIVVDESALKMGPLRPSPTTYFFDDADFLFAFAKKNKMQVRGHNFVWHEQVPKWFESYVTQANAERVLVEHIEHVAGRYAGRVHSWDVVNEAIQIKDGLPGGFRNSVWQKLLPGHGGAVPGYIEIAFRTARRVDPKAMLVYNDYGIEAEDKASEAKRRAVMDLLRGMQARGIPLDALGVQSHLTAGSREASGPEYAYGPGLRTMMAEARAMGLKVLLTEMDVNDGKLPSGVATRDEAVAKIYGNYLQTVLAEEAVIAVLTWGITDRYTWLDYSRKRDDNLPQRCLPFDADIRATPAFFAEREALADAVKRSTIAAKRNKA